LASKVWQFLASAEDGRNNPYCHYESDDAKEGKYAPAREMGRGRGYGNLLGSGTAFSAELQNS
jgi:hypothetical protein